MKKTVFLIFTVFLLLCASACSGNFSKIDLNNPVPISESGIIEKSVFDKIKNDGAVATFVGESNGFEYRWIIFGRDITEAKNVNLSVWIDLTENGVSLRFSEKEDYGFTALLSVYLNEKWSVGSVTAYCDGEVFSSVSITGSKTSILNVPVDRVVKHCEIIKNSFEDESSAESKESATSDDVQIFSEDTVVSEEPSLVSDEVVSETEETNSTPDDSSSVESELNSRPVSDGTDTSKDKYETEPVPEGKPLPVEPEDQEIDSNKTYTCTFSIECSTILNNLSRLDPDKLELIPSNGVILAPTEVTFHEGESVFDVLKRVCIENSIHLEFSWTPVYNSAYIEGIYNLYEFDCGELSGWMYRVNGWYPNYGCSRYQLADGEAVEWRYTFDLGRDVGEEGMWRL